MGVTQKKIVPHTNSSLKAEAMKDTQLKKKKKKDTQLLLGARHKKEKQTNGVQTFTSRKIEQVHFSLLVPLSAANTPGNYT